MNLSLIVAMGQHRGIGYENQLPWRLKSDLKRFKDLTLGHHLIMGRKTYESIGRPLPGRETIVVTRQGKDFVIDHDSVTVVASLDEAITLCERRGESEAFVCGGGQIYEQSLEKAHKIYLTTVDYEGQVDTFFPHFSLEGWQQIQEEHFEKSAEDHYASHFQVFEKMQN
jgi:dihydrofolate reductase